MSLADQLSEIIDSAAYELSDILPSEWCEQNRIMTPDETPYPGKFSYDRTPYCREIVDCLSPAHPAKIIAVQKGAQIGFSTGVIEPAIGYIISQSPGNILYLTGHSNLSEESIMKIDRMIDNSGLRPLIKPTVLRKRNSRTGDTNKSKEFPGGSLVSGSATNHKLLRQRSVRYAFVDDFEAAKHSSKESGSTRKMIEQRLAAYASKMKLFYISTPELRLTSNIEPVFLMGDQRRYHIPCPCCGVPIPLLWSVDLSGSDGEEKAGMTWKVDTAGKLIADSVGYICQQCGGFFDDSDKGEWMLDGFWQPTAEPEQPHYYSYHISSLYAPPGMYNWQHYVRQYMEANPPDAPQIEDLQKTFITLCLGETYEPQGEEPKANDLQRNLRNYKIGVIPEKLSINDGNGKIMMVTCAADLNGIVEDARLDYEIVAWAESGASYSVTHGSIGTFIPREGSKKIKVDRPRMTYEHHRHNSVWPEFKKILDEALPTDTGRKMKIFITGVDTGQYSSLAYPFIDSCHEFVVGLKGDKENKFRRIEQDSPTWKPAKERRKLYLVDVNLVKDQLASHMKLKWDKNNDPEQPPNFMNYPLASDGKYQYDNFFSHYESEKIVPEKKDDQTVGLLWKKKSTNAQNHFWDVRVYNIVVRDILVGMICKARDIQKGIWSDYVAAMRGG